MWIEQFQEHSAMLDQVVADLAGPKNLNKKAPIPLAIVLTGDEHADFLALKTSGANESNSRGRDITAQELNLTVIRRENLGGLNERDAAMLTALHIDGSHSIVMNDLANGLLNLALLVTVAGFCGGN
jgi:hypothetical protein